GVTFGASDTEGGADDAGLSVGIELPGSAGGARAGGAGNAGAQPTPARASGQAGAMYVPEEDLPEWFGRVTGWWGTRHKASGQKRTHLTFAPFVTSSPLIGVGFGLGGAGTVQLGDPATTPLSTFSTSLLVTTNSQYSVPIRTDINLPEGEWNLMGLWRFNQFPSPTWGLGGNTPDSAKTIIDYTQLTFLEVISHKLVGDLYLGAGYYADWLFNISDTGAANGQMTPFSKYPWGTGSQALSTGPCVNLLYDSRDSDVNPYRGWYADLNYSLLPTWLGSTTGWQSIWAEGRTYVPLWQRAVLAFWAYGWFNFGQVPYLELASIGGDPYGRSGRGYIEGRHIGKSLLYGEAELRVMVWNWLSMITAVNVHSAAQPGANGVFQDEPRFQYWSPAVVVGMRLLIVKPSRSNVCLDFALGRQSHGVYLNFAETF
ncbi:MAG TPA: hypothetical protein VMG58_11965, partial [Candidatus Sulfotelmatobacter sp.]|nr:hypothetical protein [Candidatus Sulfotelmatobacter sp.]